MRPELVEGRRWRSARPSTSAVLSLSKGSGHRTFDCERCPKAFQPRSSIRRTRSVTGSSVEIISAQKVSEARRTSGKVLILAANASRTKRRV